MDTMYREEILEHYREPQHFGIPESYDVMSHQHNPFCGDDVTMYVSVADDAIDTLSFNGKGCAISIAAASMLTEFAEGRSVAEMKIFSDEDMIGLLGIHVSDTRKKCALLALATLKDCL
jgi:nitrogen fixation NifU-like protein